MKEIIKLAKKSWKKVFLKLKLIWPIFCNSLNSQIYIWRSFYNHIVFSKKRSDKILIKRFLVFPFIEDIIEFWEIKEERIGNKWEKYIKISLKDWEDVFSVVIYDNWKRFSLLSCFLEIKK